MTTPLIIQGTTVANIPQLFRAYSEVQPFNYRDGATYTQILESMRVWILDDLVPYLNTNFSDVQDNWDENIASIVDSINVALQTALNAIAEADVIITDPVIIAALQAATSQSRTWLDARFEPKKAAQTTKVLAGTGIDLTGATDSATAVQAFLDACVNGDTVVVPGASVISLATGVNINKRIKLTGSGEIRYIGADGPVVLTATVDGTHLDGLRLTNPNLRAVKGIRVSASVARITNNYLTEFQDGIQVYYTGEYHDIIIADNQVLDIIGSGAGSGSGSTAGEANGDGIVVWGAAATITGNRVTAKVGRDARIGIHCEALAPNEVTPYANGDALITIGSNVVSGPFRRGIVSEGVAHVAITGNAIADSTFWGIAIISAHYNTVIGNTIRWTRTVNDTQGSSQAPTRSGMLLYSVGTPLTGCIIAENVIYAIAGSNIQNGIYCKADSALASNGFIGNKISGNQIIDDSGTLQMSYGINVADASTGMDIRDNRIPVFRTAGIRVFQGTNVSVVGNKVVGLTTNSGVYGIFLEGGAGDAQVSGNRIETANTAISTQFRSGLLQVIMNAIKGTTTGWDAFSSTTAVGTAFGNAFLTVTTKTANVPAGIIQTGANN